MPDVSLITRSMMSLRKLKGFESAPSIIMADSPDPDTPWACPGQIKLYSQYLAELSRLVESSSGPFANTLLIKRGTHSGLNGSMVEVFNYVSTPLVYINQHDLIFAGEIDMRIMMELVSRPDVHVLYFMRRNRCDITVNDDLSVSEPKWHRCGFKRLN